MPKLPPPVHTVIDGVNFTSRAIASQEKAKVAAAIIEDQKNAGKVVTKEWAEKVYEECCKDVLNFDKAPKVKNK